ncbi:MAG: DUF4097 domain-containing protein, partial [Clostridiales Family XIII bacterium]|nr:DUF4097 domain-containing protein [Clostridiales Family XIII bacterium]
MNKYTKTIVAVATAMIAAGVILSAVGLALGGFRSVHFGSQGFYVSDDARGAWSAPETVSRRLDDFDTIDIDVTAYAITLREGDAYGIKLKSGPERETPYIHAEDGVLTVRENGDALRQRQKGFFASRLPILPFQVIHNDWDGAVIEITYPDGARLADISVEAAAGDVNVLDLAAASLSVVCAAGNLEIENSEIDKLRVSLNAGKCEIKDTRAGDAEVEMDAGSLKAKDFDCGALRGSLRMGEVDVEGSLRGDVDISADMGDVSVRTDLPKSKYRLDLDVLLGNVTVDGRDFSGGNAGIDKGGDASAP